MRGRPGGARGARRGRRPATLLDALRPSPPSPAAQLAVEPVAADASSADVSAPEAKHTVVFSVCVRCGYRKTAELLAEGLRERIHEVAPELEPVAMVVQEESPGQLREVASKVVAVAQVVLAVLSVVGAPLANRLHVPLPSSVAQTLREKPFLCAAGVALFGNMVRQSLWSTGAFEVVADGKLIHSKRIARRIAEADDIYAPAIRALKGTVV